MFTSRALEGLVGEIYDEFDRDISGVQHKPDGALVLPGHFPSMTCPTWGGAARGTYATVAGLGLEQFGHRPDRR